MSHPRDYDLDKKLRLLLDHIAMETPHNQLLPIALDAEDELRLFVERLERK